MIPCPRGHVTFRKRRNKRWHKRRQRYVVRVDRYCVTCNRKRHYTKGVGKAHKRLRPRCPNGHPYEGANLGVREVFKYGKDREHRNCRTCERGRWARSRAKRIQPK